MTANQDINQNEVENDVELKNEWMIRPCSVYEEEYSDCTSIKARFHQYFIFGESIDCSQWKRDANNCHRWVDNKDFRSRAELIESEKKRRMERLKNHYGNDVWEKRDKPPDDWNKPLPEYMQKEYETTFLNLKSKELKGEIEIQENSSSCCIM